MGCDMKHAKVKCLAAALAAALLVGGCAVGQFALDVTKSPAGDVHLSIGSGSLGLARTNGPATLREDEAVSVGSP